MHNIIHACAEHIIQGMQLATCKGTFYSLPTRQKKKAFALFGMAIEVIKCILER